jgi:ribonuclease-3
MVESLEALERKIRIPFKSKKLLEEALTHKSHAVESNGKSFNERLEFLGDAVLSTVVAHYLFKRFPDVDEGRLSKLKSQLVSRGNLFIWASDLDLGHYLRMSPGEEATGGRMRESLVGNAYEALVGAIFLDRGFPTAQRFIVRHLAGQKRIIETDFKSRLQELIQKKYKIPPEYKVIGELGPDHDKTFQIEVRIKRRVLGEGKGKSKKEAEQAAAKEALKKIKA